MSQACPEVSSISIARPCYGDRPELAVTTSFDEARQPRSYELGNTALVLDSQAVLIAQANQETALAARQTAEQEILDQKYPDHLISSALVVAEMLPRQQDRVARLAKVGFSPVLDIFNCGKNLDNLSYQRRAITHGQGIGAKVKVYHEFSEQAVDPAGEMSQAESLIIEKIIHSKERPKHGALYLGPSETREGWKWMRAAIAGPNRNRGDLDGVADNLIPTDEKALGGITAEGMILYVEKTLGCKMEDLDPAEIGLVGWGGIGKEIERLLRKRGIEIGVLVAEREAVACATDHLEGKPLRVLFCAGRANGVVDAKRITPPAPDAFNLSGKTFAVDAGNAPHPFTGISGGNVDVTTLPGTTVYASPYKDGVGPITVTLLFERLLDKVEQDWLSAQPGLKRIAWGIGAIASKLKLVTKIPQIA